MSSVARRAAPRATEHQEQSAFFELLELHASRHPALRYAFAIPNGGARHRATAGRLRAEGVKAGVPDVFLPLPRGRYAGLFLEFKVRPNRPTDAQRVWLQGLRGWGYCTHVAYGADDAWGAVVAYLALGAPGDHGDE